MHAFTREKFWAPWPVRTVLSVKCIPSRAVKIVTEDTLQLLFRVSEWI